jgi:hypothetical protein
MGNIGMRNAGGDESMKKRVIFGSLIFISLVSTSVALASEKIEAILHPVKYIFNGVEEELSGEYVTLNYNGHVYVPIRFIAESVGANVEYDKTDQKVIVKYNSGTGLILNDEKEPRVHVGNLQLIKGDNHTLIKGQISLDSYSTAGSGDRVFDTYLVFYDQDQTEIGKVKLEEYPGQGIYVGKAEIKSFEVTYEGVLNDYSNVKLSTGYVNRPRIEKP